MEKKTNEIITEELNTLDEPNIDDGMETSETITGDEQLKAAIEEQLSTIRRQSMLLGAQVICKTVLDKIAVAMNKPGKRTLNDYRRLVKDVEQFCKIGMSRKVNAGGETEPIEEANDNSTKLTEEINESDK